LDLEEAARAVKPRIILEFDECERPGITHAVRRSTATKVVDADAGSAYQTMCGEMLYSDSKRLSYKRGIPACIRCMVALVEEAVCL
jgi:hypothetical protein